MSTCTAIDSNPDVSGIGVCTLRTSFTLGNTLVDVPLPLDPCKVIFLNASGSHDKR
ncbi:hypothetical protein M378DRAFT_170011 [Amanita muscaria Koide BX008]|uniref:Uncharacterized protein n=1 Tax=Amanita muscaria (strain Koide BX008) TaxID=946122 RepID=A0A0C2WC93_AMAMK|nr:hypothetical protein M378DRAFT_170011 [Amanita muscaria Koide BX008]